MSNEALNCKNLNSKTHKNRQRGQGRGVFGIWNLSQKAVFPSVENVSIAIKMDEDSPHPFPENPCYAVWKNVSNSRAITSGRESMSCPISGILMAVTDGIHVRK